MIAVVGFVGLEKPGTIQQGGYQNGALLCWNLQPPGSARNPGWNGGAYNHFDPENPGARNLTTDGRDERRLKEMVFDIPSQVPG